MREGDFDDESSLPMSHFLNRGGTTTTTTVVHGASNTVNAMAHHSINDDAFHLLQPPPCSLRLSNYANRLLHSTAYSIFYVFMIFINVALIVWIIVAQNHYPTHWLFICLEVFINLALASEVLLKVVAQGRVTIYKRTSSI